MVFTNSEAQGRLIVKVFTNSEAQGRLQCSLESVDLLTWCSLHVFMQNVQYTPFYKMRQEFKQSVLIYIQTSTVETSGYNLSVIIFFFFFFCFFLLLLLFFCIMQNACIFFRNAISFELLYSSFV